MIPIQDLLNRIRWDEDFGKGNFAIGYYDRVVDKIITVPFQELEFMSGDHFSFQLFNLDGELCSVPFHRIRRVYKDGAIIWERKGHNPNAC